MKLNLKLKIFQMDIYYYKYDKDKPSKKNIEDIIKHLNQLNQDVNENNEIKIYLLLYPFKLFE